MAVIGSGICCSGSDTPRAVTVILSRLDTASLLAAGAALDASADCAAALFAHNSSAKAIEAHNRSGLMVFMGLPTGG
ncbi:hypothetical protein D3C81_2186890 [compost metagenome]